MNVNDYLKRIHCETISEPTLDNLKLLHQNHVRYLPFENLDIHIGRRIEMSIEKTYEKLVKKNRGGFCFELNYLFSWLLKELGYKIKLQSCRVYNQTNNSYSPWFSHLTIMVSFGEASYLCDVGFSYPYRHPIEFTIDKIQSDMIGYMKIQSDPENNCFTLLRCNTASAVEELKDESLWTPVYQIDTEPRIIDDFNEMLDWVQSTSNVRFYNRSLCIRHIDDGIMMLIGLRLSILHFENSFLKQRDDVVLERDQALSAVRDDFNIVLDKEFDPKDVQ